MTPLGKLLKDGISVAAAPTGGMGLALTEDGKLPPGILFVGTATHQIDFGLGNLTFSAAAQSSAVTISHSLGVVPRVVFVTPADDMAVSAGPACAVGNLDSDSFTVRGHDAANIARTGNVLFYWIAIS